MAITVTITDQPIYVTVDETSNTVTLNQSDNPITVSTSIANMMEAKILLTSSPDMCKTSI